MSNPFRTTLIATAMALLPLAAHANLIANGGFSSSCGSSTFCTYGAGDDTNVINWSVGSGSVDLITQYWQTPPGGGNSVDLDGSQAASLFTTFATSIGTTYAVNFMLSGNPDNRDSLKIVRVSASGSFDDFSFDTSTNTRDDMMWTAQTFAFTADAATATLTFQSLDAGNSAYGPVIGNVSADAASIGTSSVPEPMTLAIFGAGVAGMGAMRRRKAKRPKQAAA